MASERSKRRGLLACIFITKSISKKLLTITFKLQFFVMSHSIEEVFLKESIPVTESETLFLTSILDSTLQKPFCGSTNLTVTFLHSFPLPFFNGRGNQRFGFINRVDIR